MKLWRYFQQLVLYLNKFWSFFYRDRIQLQDSVCSNFQRYTDYLVLNLLTCSQKSFLPNTHFHRWGNIYKKIWIVILLVYYVSFLLVYCTLSLGPGPKPLFHRWLYVWLWNLPRKLNTLLGMAFAEPSNLRNCNGNKR